MGNFVIRARIQKRAVCKQAEKENNIHYFSVIRYQIINPQQRSNPYVQGRDSETSNPIFIIYQE